MIPKSECKDRRLYRIHSRNLTFGVYRASVGGFLGLRRKFDNTYIFIEFHHENEKFGTVRPEEELADELPADIQMKEDLGSVCETCGTPCHYAPWPEGGNREITLGDGSKMEVLGQWEHLATTECKKVMAMGKNNAALERWLLEMEKKWDKCSQDRS